MVEMYMARNVLGVHTDSGGGGSLRFVGGGYMKVDPDEGIRRGRELHFPHNGLKKAIFLFTVAVGGKGRFRMLGLVTQAFRDFR
jgi:hypothetical protein